MANSTANVQSFGAIAMTAAGRALAVVTSNRTQIQSWQVGDDLVDWTSAGTVDIGSAWN